MSEDDHTITELREAPERLPEPVEDGAAWTRRPARAQRGGARRGSRRGRPGGLGGRRGLLGRLARRRGRRRRPRLRKLRLILVLAGFMILAVISTLFGMLMAVAADLPQIENRAEYSLSSRNSYLYDDHWRPIGIFAPPNHEVIDTYAQLGPMMRDAIVSVEDKRFWSDPGIDLRGILRAFVADVTGRPTQGASTIAEQFVKQALNQENNRTIFEKLREAALAFHLTREWPRTKILTEYLNSIYFGNGAYGAESAARVYFGKVLGYDPSAPAGSSGHGCGDPPLPSCASMLSPAQAALLAGMVANPSAFDPVQFPAAARARRDLVLQDMLAQGYISRSQYYSRQGIYAPLPTAAQIEQPIEPPAAPYFTSWLRPQILAALGLGRGVPASVAEYRAYYGGLKIRTTIDLPMQQAAQEAIAENLPEGPGEPVAALVAIDNRTGQVRAMVGGPLVDGRPDFAAYPFNIATEGERQPGSAFKPFTLAVALEHGYGPSSVFVSRPLNLVVPNSGGKEIYHVRNFGNEYLGPITLAEATIVSDNSVFTQLGLSPGVGTRRIAAMARAMGIRTPVSTNYAMIIGGLKVGVSALDMAHAYETIAEGGRRVYDPVLGAPQEGPIGIAQIYCPSRCDGKRDLVAVPHYRRVIPPGVAATIQTMLEGVAEHGTGVSAAIPGVMVAGKTGTTSDYGDAWFVGWTPELTCAVWVGYPNGFVPMTHQFNGGPVEGGTFPAEIWRAFMIQALQIYAEEGDGGHPHTLAIAAGGPASVQGSAAPSGAQPAGPPAPSGAGSPTGGAQAGGGTAVQPSNAPSRSTPAQGAGTAPVATGAPTAGGQGAGAGTSTSGSAGSAGAAGGQGGGSTTPAGGGGAGTPTSGGAGLGG
ncbi:MAG TPA: transglycosylase domain-containing protein [Solirubrobacteraceae bacterium]|nr:transglycosylase domain-containing protein [Solirubrobacteraceae bacterium]